MLEPLILSSTVVGAIACILYSPRKAKQTEWMRGVTDAANMVEACGLAYTAEYFERESYGHDYEAYEHGWASYLYSKQAKLQDLDHAAHLAFVQCIARHSTTQGYTI
jgi:hypothetical protein